MDVGTARARTRTASRLAVIAAASATLATGAIVGVASPAAAGTFQPVRLQLSTVASVVAIKSVTVSCPQGLVVYGTGGAVSVATGSVALTAITPSADLTEVTVVAQARAGTSTVPWAVTATAVCAEPTYQPVRVSSSTVAGWVSTATCPAGTVLYGTGYSLVGLGRDVYLSELAPDVSLGSVKVRAGGPALAPVITSAYGICGWSMPSAVRLSGTTDLNPVTPKTATTDACPPGENYGSWVFGVGGLVKGASDAFIDRLEPSVDLTVVYARAVRAAKTVGAGSALAAKTAGGSDGSSDYSTTSYSTCIGSWY